jgi:transketolase
LAAETKGPVYLRFSREKTPVITTDKTAYAPGKIQTFWVTDNPQATIFATGHLLYYALLAAKNLEKNGINVLVVNVSSIKPLDGESLLEEAKTGAIVSVEDHQIAGGLGSALAEFFAKNKPLPMEFVGLQDTFAESGKALELIRKYKMDETAIVKAVIKVIGRKNKK